MKHNSVRPFIFKPWAYQWVDRRYIFGTSACLIPATLQGVRVSMRYFVFVNKQMGVHYLIKKCTLIETRHCQLSVIVGHKWRDFSFQIKCVPLVNKLKEKPSSVSQWRDLKETFYIAKEGSKSPGPVMCCWKRFFYFVSDGKKGSGPKQVSLAAISLMCNISVLAASYTEDLEMTLYSVVAYSLTGQRPCHVNPWQVYVVMKVVIRE